MVTRTSREIIQNAYFYANAKNTKITDFYSNTLLLNNIYSELYIDLVKKADDYIKWADVEGNEMDIPSDCFLVMGVYQVSGNDSLTEIESLPKNQVLKGNYYKIENNVIKILSNSGRYRIKYSTMPMTLTAPDDMEKIDIDYIEVGKMEEDGFYYKNSSNVGMYYNFNTQTSEEKDYIGPSISWTYLDGTLFFNEGVVKYNGEVVDYFDKEGTTISKLVACDPYAMVTYSDGTIYIFTGFDGVNWNPKAITGHKTRGSVLGLCTNDSTGKGCIYSNGGTLYYASFVPDTILSYPSNCFFALIEYKMAAVIQSLNGMDNKYLVETLIPQAEVAFEKVVKRDSYRPYRIENVNPRRTWI